MEAMYFLVGEFLCKDGNTVSEVRVCNQIEDCADASDEIADSPACGEFQVKFLSFHWASCKIRKIDGCACAGNVGNVFPSNGG